MIKIEKISLVLDSEEDFRVVSTATAKYSEDLGNLKLRENTMQQNLHLAILQVFRQELMKKMISRKAVKSLSMEIFTAFVCYDSLQHYSNHCDCMLDQAIIRRLVTQLYRDLPTTSDNCLSIHSSLNFSQC